MTGSPRESLDTYVDMPDAPPAEKGLYVYGVVAARSDGVPDGLTGIDEAPVELVNHGEICAAVGAITLERPPGRRADLVAHTAVLDALAAEGPVVPVQFGSVLRDADDVVQEFLEPGADRFSFLLGELAGRSQFNVRARYHEEAVLEEVVDEDPKIASLRERTRELPEDVGQSERIRLGELVSRALERKREQDSAIVLDMVLPHAAAHSPRAGSSLDHLMDAAFLVDDSQRSLFEDSLEAAAEAMHERARIQLTGPMAPYDFVGE